MKIISTDIKNLDPIKTIAISHIGNYSGIETAFEKLYLWAEANNLWAASPKMLGVYHDDITEVPVEKLRSEACLEDLSGIEPGEGMHHYDITGGKYFVVQVEVTMAEYSGAWEKACAIFSEKGYEYDMRDFYELYESCDGDTQGDNSPWVVNICLPVK